jgi:hypothetical protein
MYYCFKPVPLASIGQYNFEQDMYSNLRSEKAKSIGKQLCTLTSIITFWDKRMWTVCVTGSQKL